MRTPAAMEAGDVVRPGAAAADILEEEDGWRIR